jgi:hypothetical protein
MPRWMLAFAAFHFAFGLVGVAAARDSDDDETLFNGEVLFGAQTISSLVDRDVIKVRPKIGKFDRVRFRALGRDVSVLGIEAVYDDGKSVRLLGRELLRRNRKTDWVELPRADFLKELRIVYRPDPKRDRRARIEVFGEYANGWLGEDGEGRKHNDGWVLVGTDTAGMRGLEKVTIKVGENDGYKKLRIAAKHNDIRMRYLTVVYEDGSKDDVTERRRRVYAGKEAGPFELEKDDAIVEIRGHWTSPDSTRRTRRYATVQVWGKP